MKTLIVTMSLLLTSLAFAAPVAAECVPDAGTGTAACADVYDTGNYGASASQDGVGGAMVDAYEFSFFGMTQRGKNAFVYTESGSPAGYNSVSVNEFCFVAPDGTCAFQDHAVFVNTEQGGFWSVSLSQSAESRMLCYSVADQFGCQEF